MAEPRPPVTIIIPVYRGLADVERCLASVRRHAISDEDPPGDFELLIINDASPEPQVAALLRDLDASAWPMPVTVVHHERNLGFVATVNEGFRGAAHDVVVLNADTVVTAGWLTALQDVACSGPDVATVTPLSGFGSICTLPASVRERFGLNGEAPLVDDCAAFVAASSLALHPEVITGVGFCLYVTRRAIDLVGPLDEAAFGTGYGEEVDFCLRASALGLRHVVADEVFVHHRGGGSFGAEARVERMAAASEVLHRRYPSFDTANRAERRANPLAVSFAALELGLHQRNTDRLHVLHVLHSSPAMLGGTEQHVMALIEGLSAEMDASILYFVNGGFVLRTMWWGPGGERTQHEFLLPGVHSNVAKVFDEAAAQALAVALELFDIDAVHLQNIVGHSLAPLEVLRDFDGPVVCSVRDLYLACPHHWLLTPDLQPCGIPEDLGICAECLPSTRGLERSDLEEFRAFVTARLDVVDHWVFASQSACDYLLRVYDIASERIVVIEHGSLVASRPDRVIDRSLIFDEPLRLGFVGVGWPKKGLDVVNGVADALAGTSVEVHHFGKLRAPASPSLRTHGPYDNALLPELLVRSGIQVVLLPVPFAETFGHVLTEAFVAGLPVIGTSYGALGERIRDHQAGWTVDPADGASIVALVENLDASRAEILRATKAAHRVPVHTVAETAHRYAALYRSGPPGRVHAPEGDTPMNEEVEGLRRHLRALALVNRRLHAQVADLQPSKAQVKERAASVPLAPIVLDPGARSAAHHGTDLPTMTTTSGSQPHLTRRSDGLVFLVDSDGRRKVKSGLLAAALEMELGPMELEGESGYGRAGDALPLEILVGPTCPPYVIVGGLRMTLRGLPVPRAVDAAEEARYPEGKTLDLARANVARSRSVQRDPSDFGSQVKRVLRGVKRRISK